MNEEDEITWADSSSRVALTCASIDVNCPVRYSTGEGHTPAIG
jgi:hypothetical protein